METVYTRPFSASEREPLGARSAEVVKIECRQHWFVMTVPASLLLLLAGIGFLLDWLLIGISDILGRGPNITVQMLIPVICVGPGIVVLLLCWVLYRTSEITLTNRRAVVKAARLFRAPAEIDLNQVETVTILKPVLGRFFNYGTVRITAAGGNSFPIGFIANPQQFYQTLRELVNKARAKPG